MGGPTDAPSSPQETAERFLSLWKNGDYDAMYDLVAASAASPSPTEASSPVSSGSASAADSPSPVEKSDRDKFVGKMCEAYGMSAEEAELQLAAWRAALREVNPFR